MSLVFLSVSFFFRVNSTDCSGEFRAVYKHFQNLENQILNILKEKLRLSYLVDSFRIAQCKQPRLVKPLLNFDKNFIFKSTDTALVQVKRAFKSYFLSPKKNNNKKAEQTCFAWKFLQTPYKCAEVPISPISKSTPPFSAAPFFSKNISTLNKMGKKYTVNYHPSPSKLTSRVHPHISMDSQEVYLSRIFLEIFLKPAYISHQPWLQKTDLSTRREGEGGGQGGMDPHFFWNRTLPGIFSWKFVFVSFSKASKTFFWLRHFQNLVRGPGKVSNLWC